MEIKKYKDVHHVSIFSILTYALTFVEILDICIVRAILLGAL